MTTLNRDQQKIFDTVFKTNNLNLLTAKGGCGKSYLTAQIIAKELEAGTLVTIVAPSHTARSVIEKEITNLYNGDGMWNNQRHQVLSMTVAAALGKRPDFSKAPSNFKDTPFIIDINAGKLLDNTNKDKNRLLIIEEISMVGKLEIIKMLDLWGDHPILAVGDFRQIPPVNASSCKPTLIKYYKEGTLSHFKLEQNMRSDRDTNIVELCDMVYDQDGILANELIDSEEFKGVTFYNKPDEFKAAFKNRLNDGATCTAIAYKNKQVNNYMQIGSGSDAVDIRKGDLVRLHEGITIDYKDLSNKWVKETVANNGDIVKVLDYKYTGLQWQHPLLETPIEYGVITLDIPHPDFYIGGYIKLLIPGNINDGANAGTKGAYGKAFGELLKLVSNAVKELNEGDETGEYYLKFYNGLNDYDTGMRTILDGYDTRIGKGKPDTLKYKSRLLFGRGFYGERSQFINLTKLYSLTAHKSQGQSIDVIFADLADIVKSSRSSETKHLSYVACSRAKKELHVLI